MVLTRKRLQLSLVPCPASATWWPEAGAILQATESIDTGHLPAHTFNSLGWACPVMGGVNSWDLSHPVTPLSHPQTQKFGLCSFVFSSYHLWFYLSVSRSSPGLLKKCARIFLNFSFTLSLLKIMRHQPLVYCDLGVISVFICVCVLAGNNHREAHNITKLN